MSSIGPGTATSIDWSRYGVDPEGGFGVVATGDGNYQLVDDPDGPGGAAPVAGATVDEATLNQLLEAAGAGFTIIDGVRVESDSVTRGTGGTIDFSELPLPGVAGTFAKASEKAAWLQSFEGASDACLMWMGLLTLARSARQDALLADVMKDQAHVLKRDAKQAEIGANIEKIKAEQDAALQQMVVSCVVAAATTTVGIVGLKWDPTALNAAMTATSTLGQAVTATSNWIGKAMGPQAEADRKQIEAMRLQARAELFDAVIEDKKATYDEAKEQFKAALKLIEQHYDMQLQTTGRIFQ